MVESAWRIGVIGLAGIVAFLFGSLIGAPSAPPASTRASGGPTPDPPPALPSIGQSAVLDGWEVMCVDVGPYERFDARKPATPPRGRRLVINLMIRNLRERPAVMSTSDFEVATADGESFGPSSETASIRGGFLVSQSVAPGAASEIRLVFDLDPKVQVQTLTALGMRFRIAGS